MDRREVKDYFSIRRKPRSTTAIAIAPADLGRAMTRESFDVSTSRVVAEVDSHHARRLPGRGAFCQWPPSGEGAHNADARVAPAERSVIPAMAREQTPRCGRERVQSTAPTASGRWSCRRDEACCFLTSSIARSAAPMSAAAFGAVVRVSAMPTLAGQCTVTPAPISIGALSALWIRSTRPWTAVSPAPS